MIWKTFSPVSGLPFHYVVLIVSFDAQIFLIFFKFFKRFYLFIFRQREREGEREGEKHQYVVASSVPLTGGLACNPGMCPDWESNLRPFGLQASAQSTMHTSQVIFKF